MNGVGRGVGDAAERRNGVGRGVGDAAERSGGTAEARQRARNETARVADQRAKPSAISSMSSSRSSTVKKAPAAAFSWNASRSARS